MGILKYRNEFLAPIGAMDGMAGGWGLGAGGENGRGVGQRLTANHGARPGRDEPTGQSKPRIK
jgi:hypothetical protein